MLIKKIKMQKEKNRIPVIFWLYAKQETYKVIGDLVDVEKWITDNIDSSLAYIYHIYFFRTPMKSHSFMSNRARHGVCKNKNHSIVDWNDENLFSVSGVSHPVTNLSIIPYEKYFNYIIKGDSSLEYTVNCYGKKQKYALVQNQLWHSDRVHKLLAVFSMIPRHYMKELDDLL